MTDRRRDCLGFGFVPCESQHHFIVAFAKGNGAVSISEHTAWDASEAERELRAAIGQDDPGLRVILSRARWQAIADPVRAELNQRLKKNGHPSGDWKADRVPLSRLLGKEVVLLTWAIEDVDVTLIPTAVANWLGLAPEERWWLFTMTNAATGHASANNRGWRKAVRFALTENPVTETRPARQLLLGSLDKGDEKWATPAPKRKGRRDAPGQAALFETQES